MIHNSKKIKKILFSLVLFGEIRFSYQISASIFGKIINNNQNALKCFDVNQYSDGSCSEVKNYINNIRNAGEVNSQCFENINKIVDAKPTWGITYYNFEGIDVDTSIFNVVPSKDVKGMKFSNNQRLKSTALTIPDSFIQELTSCPFQNQNDNIKVNNCSSGLKAKCMFFITCITSYQTPTVPTNPVPIKTPVIDKPSDKENSNTTPDPGQNTNPSSGQNTNTSNKNNPSNGNTDKPNTNNGNNNTDDSTNDSGDLTKVVQVNSNPEDDPDSPKTLLETFLFGLLTSVGVLGFVFLVLCVIQTYTKKRILNFKRLSYEDKPLVKSNSSSMNESVSNFGTHSNSSNYNPSTSSQTSYTTKHKRYLYVFDDGSVMMSKSLNRPNQNSSVTTPTLINPNNNANNFLNEPNNTMPKYTNSEAINSIHSSNSNLTISISPNTSYNTTISPLIGSPIIGSPIKSFNKNINLSVPQNYVTEMNNRLDEHISNGHYSTTTK